MHSLSPSLFLSNIRSLLPKLDEISIFAATTRPHVLVFCETWLNSGISDLDVTLPSYHSPLRYDRRPPKRGGGVCVYIRNDVTVCDLSDKLVSECPSSIEGLWILLPSFRIVLCSLYVPPSLSSDTYKEICEFIITNADRMLSNFVDCRLIVLGDLNQLPTTILEQHLDMVQVVSSPTRGTSILDKVLISTSLREQYGSPIVGPNFGKADHLTVQLCPNAETSYSPSLKKVYDFRRCNVEAFVSALKAYPWHRFYLSENSLELKCQMFCDVIRDALSKIPFTFVPMTPTDKPWMTPLLKHLINCRFQAYRSGQFEKFNYFKFKVKREIVAAKKNWILKLKNSGQGVWKAAGNSRFIASSNSLRLFSLFSSPKEIANALNSTFASSFFPSSVPVNIPDFNGRSWQINITQESVEKLIMQLKPGKSAGIDNLTPRLLKAACGVLAGPITHLFCLSVEACKVPREWKNALVVPLPKKKNPGLSDFRPISLLPIVSKLLEKLVLTSVKQDLISLYGPNQFGFRPGSSTLHAQIYIHDFVTRELDEDPSCSVALVSFDLSKAFDRLSHSCLLQTLLNSDLPPDFVRWITSFLHDRRQRVLFHGSLSNGETNVTSGVPQGSILAPYLFAAHIGALVPYFSTSRMIKYADDIMILFRFKSSGEFNSRFQKESQNIEHWCDANGLSINKDKTKLLIFPKLRLPSLPDNLIACDSLKVLGVFFNSDLRWNKHTDHLVSSASRRFHVLRKLKHTPGVTKSDLVQIYNGFIRGVMEYNCPIFVGMNKKNASKLEKVRRRCHAIVCGASCACDAFQNLSSRRETIAINNFLKLSKSTHILHTLFPPTLPRSKRLFVYPRRTERRARSLIPFCTDLCNSRL